MDRNFLLLIFISWYQFLLVKSSLSFFDFDKHLFQTPHFIYENFSIGANFTLPSSYKCSYSQCLVHLKLTLKNDNKLSINLWCDSPAVLITEQNDQLSCVINGIDGTVGSYRLSAVVQVHTAGSFIPVLSAIFLNDPESNQEWIDKEIFILNSTFGVQQLIKSQTIKRKRRQDVYVNGANNQPTVNQDGSINYVNNGQTQTMSVNDGTNMNQPIQLNTYSGTLNPGYTVDVTCNGPSSCPNYPKTDEQGRVICCFTLPQVSDSTTALSSVIYQNGAQNLNDFQVNVGDGQSFNAANDLSVFISSIIPASQCNVLLPTETTQPISAQFRITWTYSSNTAIDNSALPSIKTLNDGTLPVNVLRVTSTSAFVQQRTDYNEWFICPPSQDGQISLLRSIALLSDNNIDYFRCIYVNNQGIPLKDPITGQLLVFSSTKNSASDNPAITTLPSVHTDCISIQFFSNPGTTVDLNAILLSITVAFQTAPTTDISSVIPQASDLQGTYQIQIDVTVDLSPSDDSNAGNNVQTSLSSTNDNLSNIQSIQCTRYQVDLPMSYDISIWTIYCLISGNTLEDVPITSISKIILQATALQDVAMDSTLRTDIVICPTDADSTDSASVTPSRSIPSPQIYNQGVNGFGSPPIYNIAPVQSLQSPPAVSSDGTVNCQERTSSTYGTYPPDLSALTIPTKKPPKLSKTQPAFASDMYVTPSTPYQNINAQTLPGYTCFNQISLTNNPFVYDILISNSDYTNSVDCLSTSSDCSINFTNTKQPKITLLFAVPACISYLRIPSPSNVQQFSYSMYDEDGMQIQLPGAVDNQGTLLSSSSTNPMVQFNQYACGYSSIIQLLTTSDNGPPMRVTIDIGGCFRNLSATVATTLAPIQPAVAPSFWSQQIPPIAPAPPNIQPIGFAPSPVFAPSPAVPLFPSPLPSPVVQQLPPPSPLGQQLPPVAQQSPLVIQSVYSPMIMPLQQPSQSVFTSPPSIAPAVPLYCANNYQLTPLTFGSQCISSIVTNDPNVVPNNSINPGNQGLNFRSNIPITIIYEFSCTVYIKYICITGTSSNVNKFSYVMSNVNRENVGVGSVTQLTPDQCLPRPLPTAELVNQVVIIIEETTDGQPPKNLVIDMQGCFSLPTQTSQTQYIQPSPLSVLQPIQSPLPPTPVSIPLSATPILSPFLPLQPPPLSPSVPVAPPPASFQIMLSSQILQSPLAPQPMSPATFPSAPLSYQNMLASPIVSPLPPPLPPLAQSPIVTAPPQPVFQTMVTSPISQLASGPLQFAPSLILSPTLEIPPPPPAPVLYQTMLPSSILSPPPVPASSISQQLPSYSVFSPPAPFPSPQAPIQPPLAPAQQYSPPAINPSPVYQTPSISSSMASSTINTEPLPPLFCPTGTATTQFTLYGPYVSQISTSDPNAIVDNKINPGAEGINFQSNIPVTISVKLKYSAQIVYICIPGPTTNVGSFSYSLRDRYNNPVGSGSINAYGSDQCVPRPLNVMNPAAQIDITISQTKDGQPPRNVVLDLQGCYLSPPTNNPTSSPFIPVIPPIPPFFWTNPSQPFSQFMAPASPPVQIQPSVPLQTAPIPVPVQIAPSAQQTTSTSSTQSTVTPVPSASMNICPQVSLASHPGVELIVFSDGTNATNDLNPNGNGHNLVSTGTIMTVLLRDGMPATFSSIGISSSNVNQIDVALFDEQTNRPLIQSPQGKLQSPITLNPTVQNLPMNPAATLTVTFLNTVDGQPPKDVKLLVYACFPTVTAMPPVPASISPSTSGTNTLSQQPYNPVNSSVPTYPSNQQYQNSLNGPTNVCIDPSQPAQVTSVANTPLPPQYYSSNQCVCICQLGITIPPSSGVIQYYPPPQTIQSFTQRRRKRHNILIKSKN